MTTVLGLDPGSEKTGWVMFDGKWIHGFGITLNEDLRRWLAMNAVEFDDALILLPPDTVLACEYMMPRGMKTSQAEMDTMFELGRLVQAWGGPWEKVARKDVKMHLCGDPRAKDGNIVQALKDRWGGEAKAVGGKTCATCHGAGLRGRGKKRAACESCGGLGGAPRGPLYGITSHAWQALAISVTHWDRQKEK